MKKAIVSCGIVILLIAAVALAYDPVYQNVYDLFVRNITQESAGTVSLQGPVTISGTLTLSGASTNSGAQTFSSTVSYAPGSQVGMTNLAVITPTATYMQLQASGLGTQTVAAATAGQFLILENTGSTNIIIADNGTIMALGSDVTLGATDVLTLIGSATNNWRKVSLEDN